MWEQVLGFLVALLRQEPEALASGLTGLVVGAAAATYFVCRYWSAHSAADRLRLQHAEQVQQQLSQELEDQHEALLRAKTAGQRLIDAEGQWQLRIMDLEQALQRARGGERRLKREVRALNSQILQVTDADGRIWERPVPADVPPFTPRLEQRAAIIAVLNLKGGVGKTTISANLGATFAARGEQVLLVDLDYQHSLSDLCFPDQQRTDLLVARRMIDRLFAATSPRPEALSEWAARVEDTNLQVVVADEGLEQAESQAMARWLCGESAQDVRFLLRQGLHAPEVSQQFDWIILDCPPRFTTAAINAICAADYVLVPTQLDATSSNAVPRLLRWLTRLRHRDRLCPQLSLLGIVANRTQQQGKLTTVELDRWTTLQGQCADRWHDPVHFFEAFVPNKVEFARASEKAALAVSTSTEIAARFADLAAEILSRVPCHARR